MKEQTTRNARASCDRCGTVRIPVVDITLRVAEHDGAAEVRFACPGCGRTQLQPLEEDQAAALVAADVAVDWWQLPAELDEPHPSSPLELADIDRFVDFLSDDVALRLATSGLSLSRAPEAGRA